MADGSLSSTEPTTASTEPGSGWLDYILTVLQGVIIFIAILLGAVYLHPILLFLLLPCLFFFGWLAGYKQYKHMREEEAWERRERPLDTDMEKPWEM